MSTISLLDSSIPFTVQDCHKPSEKEKSSQIPYALQGCIGISNLCQSKFGLLSQHSFSNACPENRRFTLSPFQSKVYLSPETPFIAKEPISNSDWDDLNQQLQQCLNSLDDKNLANELKIFIETFTATFSCLSQEKSLIAALLPQILYLIDTKQLKIDSLREWNSLTDIRHLEGDIKETFKKSLNFIHSMEKLKKDIPSKGIQDRRLILQTKIPKEIANVLITSSGYFNHLLIDSLIEQLPNLEKNDCLPYEETLIRVLLNMKKKTGAWKSLFASVAAPDDVNAFSNFIIKVSLDLDVNTQVTAVHAKQAVLAALLSHLRQVEGAVSNFAVLFGVELLRSRPDICFKMLAELLQTDGLTVDINIQPYKLDYSPHIQDPNCQKDFKPIISTLWREPGIQAACRYMGIKNSDWPHHIEILSNKHAFTIQDILEEIATQHVLKQVKVADSRLMIQSLIKKGLFAFSAQTSPPLLRCWESLLASMAEANPHQGSIQELYEILIKEFVHEPQSFRKYFYQQLSFIYDSSVQRDSEYGAFVLKDRVKGKIVRNPHDFISSIQSVCKATKHQIRSLSNNRQTLNQLEWIRKIKCFIKNDVTFIDRILLALNPTENTETLSVKNWEHLKRLPWFLQTSNDRGTYVDSTLNQLGIEVIKKVKPKSAQKLAVAFLKASKGLIKENKNRMLSERFLITADTHAFSWTLETPLIQEWLQSNTEPYAWLTRKLSDKVDAAFKLHLSGWWTWLSSKNSKTLLSSNASSHPQFKHFLKEAALQLVNTNRSSSVHDIGFYFVYDPYQKQILFIQMNQDGSEAVLLEKKWLQDTLWTFYDASWMELD